MKILAEALAGVLTPTAVQALGWMLLHFLWQGAAVALVVAALLRLTRRSSPPLRYAIACAGLSLMVLLPGLTYAVVKPQVDAAVNVRYDLELPSAQPSIVATAAAPVAPTSTVSPTPRLAAQSNGVLNAYLPYLVAAWSMGVLLLSVRLLGGLWLLRKLKRRFNQPVHEALELRCRALAQRLGVLRAVQLRESLSVNVPLVIGWLRPMILLPTSAISGLSVGQLELILAHELAHIRRHDYLINLLQNLTETLLFYHPGVWWVSAKIRDERENCCDDLAVRACNGDRLGYAQALAKLDTTRLQHLAPAATGGSLLKRIQRLADKAVPQTPNPTQWTAGLVLLLVPLLSVSCVQAGQRPPDLLGTYVTEAFTVAELTGQGFTQAAACENAGPWMIVLSEKGFFSGNVLSEAGCTYHNPFVTGSWRLSGERVTFRDTQDLGCGLEEYAYTYKLNGDSLTFSPVKDSCPERVYLFTTHAWERPL